ncbi:MAG: ABC transporter permease [Planctomycetes bacterium]|nr:ABC transporter permease [Planctomycetota bacterium]
MISLANAWAEVTEPCREAWAVRRRLLPVVLGICFGTLGLSVLLAFGDGFAAAMDQALQRAGDAMLRWSGGVTSRAHGGQPAGRALPLLPADLERVAAAREVVAASPDAQINGRVIADVDERSANPLISAVGADWAFIRGVDLETGGRFFSRTDEQERRRVAVIGATLARQLYGTADVVGRTLRVFDAPFQIVGVLSPRAQMMQYGGDDALKVLVPFATAQAIRGLRTCGYVLTRLRDPANSSVAVTALRALLAARNGFAPDDLAAVRVVDHAAQAGQIRGIVLGTRWFLAILGVLGLLVAALSVANMMFVLVEERVPEIGLRLALGATPAQIRRRQLLETVAVVLLGGGIGLLLAALLLAALGQLPLPADARNYLGTPALAPATAALIASLLGLAAAFAGRYPAARAAAVMPVEALRHD